MKKSKFKTSLLASKAYFIDGINAYKKAFAYGDAKYWLVEYAKLIELTRGLSCENEIRKGYEDLLDEYIRAKEAYDNAYHRADKVVRWFMTKMAKRKV